MVEIIFGYVMVIVVWMKIYCNINCNVCCFDFGFWCGEFFLFFVRGYGIVKVVIEVIEFIYFFIKYFVIYEFC